MSEGDADDAGVEQLEGRVWVCDQCDWAGHTKQATIEMDGISSFDAYCPECGSSVHREYIGNPLPEEGEEWLTPNGLDECPVCGTAGIFVHDGPGCMCGAQLGGLDRTTAGKIPERGEKDVIIRASDEDLRHKVFDYTDGRDLGGNPRRELAYWRVNGTPKKTGPGRTIMFSTDGEMVDYHAPICTVEEGRILFSYLYPTKYEAPVTPPTRGFKYFEWRDYPW